MKRALRGLLFGMDTGEDPRTPSEAARPTFWCVSFVLATLALAAAVLTGCSGGPAAASGASAKVTFRFSHFEQTLITVPAGTPVSITLQNKDPIEHEWIVGTEDVHERHRTGTDGYHDALPTEVTVPALTTRKTTVRFDTPGDYPFVCHLPGHEAYGMKGVLRVVAQ